MADDKKNIPDAGKVTEPPKQEKAEPIKASPPVTEQAAPVKPEPTVKGPIPKDGPSPVKEAAPKEKVAAAPTVDKTPSTAKEQPTPPKDAPAADKATPVTKEQAAPPKEKPAPAVETKPSEKVAPAGKVLDFAAVRDEGVKQASPPKEKPPAEKVDKPGKTQETAKPAKSRPPKVDKAAPDEAQPPKPRDKVSQGKKAATVKEAPAQEQAAAGGGAGPGAGIAVEPKTPTPPPRPVEEGKLVYLKLSELHPFHTFRPHPFKVSDDAKMQETVASIKANGVMVPGLARPEKDGNGFEIIAGHRRTRGSELAGLEEMPFIVRDMSDQEAVQAMRDSNKQRDQTLPSELASLLDLEVEAIKHQGGRLDGVAPGDVGKRSVEIVGEAHDMNYKKVMRYLRLNSLVPELLSKVDEKGLGFMPAVELSYIKPKNQRLIAVSIDGEQSSPSHAQAKRLRELDQAGKLNGDVIDGILSEKKKEDRGVIISMAELEKYFGKEVTPIKMKEQIMSLLDEWKEKQPPELKKPEKKADLEK